MGLAKRSPNILGRWDDIALPPGFRAPLSSMSMLMCLRGLEDGVTVHGMRSALRDWICFAPKSVISVGAKACPLWGQ